MVKTRRGPFRLFQLRHGRGHVAPVPRPAAHFETVAAGAARGDGAGGRTRTARGITETGAARAADAPDADHGRAAAALGRWAYATTKRIPTAQLSRPGLPSSRVPAEFPRPEHALAAGGASIRAAARISSARVPGRALWATDGAGAGAGAEPEAVAVARAVSAAATAGGLRGVIIITVAMLRC